MYIITGATGNTGSVIASQLLAQGKKVTVVGRDVAKLKSLTDKGAVAAVGNLEDAAFLTKLFTGASAAYLIIPPKWDVTDWLAYQREVAASFLKAIQDSGLKKVVLLSSQGSHRPDAGPVSGLGEFEKQLATVSGLDAVILRAGYFMENLYGVIGMVKHAGILGYSLNGDVKVSLVHTRDIAAVAVKYFSDLSFKGITKVFVAGAADLTMNEVAAILGKAIGKPDLKYVTFSYADAKAGMLQAGIPETIADGYNELFKCLNEGNYLSDFGRTPENTTPTTFQSFVEQELVHAYQAQA